MLYADTVDFFVFIFLHFMWQVMRDLFDASALHVFLLSLLHIDTVMTI